MDYDLEIRLLKAIVIAVEIGGVDLFGGRDTCTAEIGIWRYSFAANWI